MLGQLVPSRKAPLTVFATKAGGVRDTAPDVCTVLILLPHVRAMDQIGDAHATSDPILIGHRRFPWRGAIAKPRICNGNADRSVVGGSLIEKISREDSPRQAVALADPFTDRVDIKVPVEAWQPS